MKSTSILDLVDTALSGEYSWCTCDNCTDPAHTCSYTEPLSRDLKAHVDIPPAQKDGKAVFVRVFFFREDWRPPPVLPQAANPRELAMTLSRAPTASAACHAQGPFVRARGGV